MDIRSFLAIEFPTSIQDAIVRETAVLREHFPFPDIRWVTPRNIHLTLKFLGNGSSQRLEILARSLGLAIKEIKPFRMGFAQAGVFPPSGRPRIIWLGIDPPGSVSSLQKMIEETTTIQGFKREDRPFSPHITIGRFSDSFPMHNYQNLMEIIKPGDDLLSVFIDVRSITLFKSELRPSGSIYSVIHDIPLG